MSPKSFARNILCISPLNSKISRRDFPKLLKRRDRRGGYPHLALGKVDRSQERTSASRFLTRESASHPAVRDDPKGERESIDTSHKLRVTSYELLASSGFSMFHASKLSISSSEPYRGRLPALVTSRSRIRLITTRLRVLYCANCAAFGAPLCPKLKETQDGW